MAADMVLVVPEAGKDIDRVEWAKQLVANAVRSPHTQQAYAYALEQFFHWAAGRAVSRESVQGYVTWLGEMKFSPSTGGKLPEEKTLDRFAWHSYLLYGRMVPLTLPAMRNRYAAAIKSLQKGANEVEETDRTLASHLIWFYAHSAIEIDDPLLVHFFTLASAALRAQAIGDIGWSIGQDDAALMPAIQERLMRLLEHRLSLLKEAPREEGRESRDLRLVAQLWEVSRGMGRGPGNANLGKTALLEPGFRSRENVRIIGEQVSI